MSCADALVRTPKQFGPRKRNANFTTGYLATSLNLATKLPTHNPTANTTI